MSHEAEKRQQQSKEYETFISHSLMTTITLTISFLYTPMQNYSECACTLYSCLAVRVYCVPRVVCGKSVLQSTLGIGIYLYAGFGAVLSQACVMRAYLRGSELLLNYQCTT